METEKSTFGKKLISARHLCPIQADDSVHEIALRILHNTCLNISEYAKTQKLAVPTNTLQAFRWLTGNKGSGFDFSLQIAGFGGGLGKNEVLPPPADVSFEALHYILVSIAEEVTSWYGMAGIFVALDNFENLDEDQIGSVLMAFRDSFFTIPKIWWVVIGQTGLTSLVQVLDPRIAERMSGSVELTPISSDELHQAIDRRVQKFHSDSGGKAPLTQDIHDFLYAASLGEIRFVFNYASKICLDFVSSTRTQVVKISKDVISSEKIAEMIGSYMVSRQIPSKMAMDILRKNVSAEIDGLGLRPKEREVLAMIGKNRSATQGEFKNFGLGSGQDFSSNYLAKFYRQHLLAKRQEGRRVHYSLRGIAAIADRFSLLSADSSAANNRKSPRSVDTSSPAQ